ncbi:hypothetical protein [Nostoc sp. LPT]|nr:hypothetical protein [Nostoc sp. LPT]MBN4000371.1 hypothetical protein [Nostoc sp. LPT]
MKHNKFRFSSKRSRFLSASNVSVDLLQVTSLSTPISFASPAACDR